MPQTTTNLPDSGAESTSLRGKAFVTREAARYAALSEPQVRRIARLGIVHPTRNGKSGYVFSFQDVVVLRQIGNMRREGISLAKILKGMQSLANRLDAHQPLSSVRVRANGSHVVVQEHEEIWSPETGQHHLNFDEQVEVLDAEIQSFPKPEKRSSFEQLLKDRTLTSEDWFNIGMELERNDTEQACAAYRQAIVLDSQNADAYINLGRLLQINDKLRDAKRLYEKVLQFSPDSELASYNLGTVYHTFDEFDLAIKFYKRAPNMALSHHNLAQIFEQTGDELSARRHFKRSLELEDDT